MPATHAQSFRSGFRQAWRWDNTDDDGEFLTWLDGRLDVDVTAWGFTVDRTGSSPELTWQPPSGPPQTLPLTEGVLYIAWAAGTSVDHVRDITTVLGGFWESDEYGRPFDLNDLLAGGAQ